MNRFALYIKSPKIGTGIEKFSFNHGFRWADNKLPCSRQMPTNPFYIIFNLDDSTMEFSPFFDPPTTMKIVAIKTEYVENEFDRHPALALLSQILTKFGRDHSNLSEERLEKKPAKLKPNPKSSPIIKRRGDGIITCDPLVFMADYIAGEQS